MWNIAIAISGHLLSPTSHNYYAIDIGKVIVPMVKNLVSRTDQMSGVVQKLAY